MPIGMQEKYFIHFLEKGKPIMLTSHCENLLKKIFLNSKYSKVNKIFFWQIKHLGIQNLKKLNIENLYFDTGLLLLKFVKIKHVLYVGLKIFLFLK